jgi:alkanesulfonate monooxygenase SsuD/methylene tetrahydromethanopterin reductase-like flavin-dependent oxidoreductase (luciferase family)
MEHGERYARAREFYDVVTGLWDSWADDAFIRDVEAGIYFDPEKLHVLGHKGKYLSVRGPLNIARPIQGWPVIVQAGASDAGRQLAAETAEAVFTAQPNIQVGRQFYADVKGRMAKAGVARSSQDCRPAWWWSATGRGEARAKSAARRPRALRQRDRASIAPRPRRLQVRSERRPKFPRATPARAGASARSPGAREKLTVRQLAQRLGGYSGWR